MANTWINRTPSASAKMPRAARQTCFLEPDSACTGGGMLTQRVGDIETGISCRDIRLLCAAGDGSAAADVFHGYRSHHLVSLRAMPLPRAGGAVQPADI